jgi:hypothetical protein
VFGQAAVAVDSDDLPVGAELLNALPAEGTFATRVLLVTDADTITRVQVGDLSTGFFDDSNDFMAEDQRERRITPSIIDELDVALARLRCVILTKTSRLPSVLS